MWTSVQLETGRYGGGGEKERERHEERERERGKERKREKDHFTKFPLGGNYFLKGKDP